MAEWDWNQIGSLAAQILPSVVGAIGGAQRGGMGIIPGALQGAGIAAQQNIAGEEERQKYNNQLAIQQQNQEFAKQRIEQENRQLEMQSRNYNRMDRMAEEQIKNYGLERQKHQMELDAATRTVEGQARFRESLSPNQQVIYDAAPNKQAFIKQHYDDKDWEAKVSGASQMLKRNGLDPEVASLIGEQGTSHLLGQIQASRLNPKDRYAYSYHDGMLIKWDKQSGQFETQELGGKGKPTSPEKRSQIEKAMFGMWKQQQPAIARLTEGDDDKALSAFNEWRTSQEGEVSEKYFNQELTPTEYRGALGSLKRQDEQITADASRLMKERYLAIDPKKQTEAGFQTYLNTPAGQANLGEYKKAVRRGGFSNRGAAVSEQSADLEYAEKNKTSLMGRKNAEKEKAAPSKSTDAKDSLLKDFGL